MRKVWIVVLVTVLVMASIGAVFGKGSNWKDALTDKISETYQLSKMSVLSYKITKPGTVLVIAKDGIVGYLPSFTLYATGVRGGTVVDAPPRRETSRPFKPGDTVYLVGADVKGDSVRLDIWTTETVQRMEKGTTKDVRYHAIVDFQFLEGTLQTTDFAEVKKEMDIFLKTEAEFGKVQTKTVSIGMTPEEVESIFGKPPEILDIRTPEEKSSGKGRMTYVYNNKKVIFVDGKVADIQ